MGLFSNNALEIGDPAPSVRAIIQTGETIDLGEILAQGVSVVFFYPKADTPGCTAQSCSLRDSFHELTGAGIKVYGVSYDNPKSQRSFIEKHDLPYDLIADEDKVVSRAFGRGFMSRQAYIIHDGKVVWRDLSASTRSQAADVKKALNELGIANFESVDG